MQDDRVGRLFRTVRIQRGLRQRDLGELAGCSQRWIAELELGRLDAMSIGTVRAVGDILEIRVTVDAWWRRGDGIRLMDAVHASLVEHTLRTLTEAGWLVVPEWSFNHFGERGSIDIVAWHDATRTLLIIEVKSRLDDVQELLHTFGRKARIAPDLLAKERGWVPSNIATMLVVGDGNASREVVRRHATTFDARWPERTARCKAFVREPGSGTSPFRGGIWFVPAKDGPRGGPVVQPQRVRRRTTPDGT
jgi:transcriptional regulator with XRE-family HTH domain